MGRAEAVSSTSLQDSGNWKGCSRMVTRPKIVSLGPWRKEGMSPPEEGLRRSRITQA